ncbi:MAG: tRNA epoxyqueuosine(34) reductase QueG [Chloroflexota bacterium]|nr:MAG: tRNA epoxyqueuosine(34) reductase QueG [Chloroflexota bacterium]
MGSLEQEIKELALELGFVSVGITTTEPLSWLEPIVEARVQAGLLSGLPWFDLERVRKSCRPRESWPQARSVVSLAVAYGQGGASLEIPALGLRGQISRYAGGDDYHQVVKHHARPLLQLIREHEAEPRAQLTSDSGRLLDRGFAHGAGVGWYGQNCSIIVPGRGSFVFLAEIVTSLHLEPDAPTPSDCGRCDACLRSCPTGALSEPYVVDSRRCISFLTIELRGSIPLELRPLMGTRIFGCDACQAYCPHNRKSRAALWPELRPSSDAALLPSLPDLLRLREDGFLERFAESPVLRARRQGLLRNAAVALGNLGDRAAVPVLREVLDDPDPVVRSHAAWALGQLGGASARMALETAARTEPEPEVAREIVLAFQR